jgi:hypothetical protein
VSVEISTTGMMRSKKANLWNTNQVNTMSRNWLIQKIPGVTSEKGAALIEFALVIPLLLILLFGIIEFGLVLYDKAMITNASREGARAGIVYRYDPDAGTNHPPDSEIGSVVQTYCQNHLITFGAPLLGITITRTGDSSGDPLTVDVTYQYKFLILPDFVTIMTEEGGINLAARTVMRME